MTVLQIGLVIGFLVILIPLAILLVARMTGNVTPAPAPAPAPGAGAGAGGGTTSWFSSPVSLIALGLAGVLLVIWLLSWLFGAMSGVTTAGVTHYLKGDFLNLAVISMSLVVFIWLLGSILWAIRGSSPPWGTTILLIFVVGLILYFVYNSVLGLPPISDLAGGDGKKALESFPGLAKLITFGLTDNFADILYTSKGLVWMFELLVIIALSAAISTIAPKSASAVVGVMAFVLFAMFAFIVNQNGPGKAMTRAAENMNSCLETKSCPDYDFTVYAGGHSAPIPVYSDCDRGRKTVCVWAQEVAQHGITTKTYGMFKVKNRDGSRRWVTGNPVCHEYLRVHVEGTPGSYKQFKIHRINGPCPTRVRPSHND